MPIRIGNQILTGKDKNVGIAFKTDTTKNYNTSAKKQQDRENELSILNQNESNNGGVITKQAHRLFLYKAPKKDQYLFDRSELEVWDVEKTFIENKKTSKKSRISIHYPEVTDTEFYTNDELLKQTLRTGLTTQIKGIGVDAPKLIFTHPKSTEKLNKARIQHNLEPLLEIKSEAHFVDYLNHCGVSAKIVTCDSSEVKKLPKFYNTKYAHFATAELLMVFSGGMKEEIREFIRQGKFQSRRRLMITSIAKGNQSIQITDWVEFNHHAIEIDGIKYAIRLRIIDTCAIYGIAGYADIAANVGWKVAYKDNFTKAEKAKMLSTAIKHPKKFEDYALGDLDVYEILEAYDKKWKEVHEKLNLTNEEQDYYQTPKLTIGGTVKDLFLAKLAQKLGITDIKSENNKKVKKWQKILKARVLEKYLTFNPGELRQYFKSTKCLLSKVEGGRCRNNRPTDIFVRRKIKGKYDVALICDIDISGCYGEGQRNQTFFIGVPVTFGLDINRYNEYPTLRKVLTELGVKIDVLCRRDRKDWVNPENWGELVPGGWIFRWGTKESLEHGQDLFASWFTKSGHGVDLLAKFIKENQANDTELVDKLEMVDFDEEYGTIKIFEHETHNSVLTHDGLQWLFGVASPRQRNEILDKGTVLCGAYYPRSQEMKVENYETALDELDEIYDKWEGTNTYEIDKNCVITRDNSCHGWFGINLGELIVNDLLIERKKAIHTHGKKSPLDQLFKLCVNTLYGDVVSKYFAISNPIVGNNITARARCLAWYMEKGLDGWQSITDGCGFLLNAILKNKNLRLDGELTVSEKLKRLKNKNISKQPLGDVDEFLMDEYGEIFIRSGDTLTSIGKGADNKFINKKAMEHLQNEFECVDILHNESTAIKVNEDLSVEFIPRVGQFSFETKDVYHRGAFDGSANYIFEKTVIKVSGVEADKEAGKEFIKSEGLEKKYPYLEIVKSPSDSPLKWEITNHHVIKRRGYEVNKPHESYNLDEEVDGITFTKSERYDGNNNPGKDFMLQLLENPEKIKRQTTGIKEGIVKIAEYQERIDSFTEMGLEPGDTVKKPFLMSEYSTTQFTFKTHEQYVAWDKACSSDKDKYSQSLESFFLNPDESLNFSELVNWVYEAIQKGIKDPMEKLDKHDNRVRASKPNKKNNGNGKKKTTINVSHPARLDYDRIKKLLN